MKRAPKEPDLDHEEWADAARTILDGVPLALDDPEEPTPRAMAVGESIRQAVATPPQGLELLPGYEVGFAHGEIYGARRAVERVLDALRLELIQAGNDPGVAFLVADKLRRRAGMPGY